MAVAVDETLNFFYSYNTLISNAINLQEQLEGFISTPGALPPTSQALRSISKAIEGLCETIKNLQGIPLQRATENIQLQAMRPSSLVNEEALRMIEICGQASVNFEGIKENLDALQKKVSSINITV